jgi:hypothetical protein
VRPWRDDGEELNEPDPDSCRELLGRSVTAEVELVHPAFGRARGIENAREHIAGYEAAMPDTRVALTRAIDAHIRLRGTPGSFRTSTATPSWLASTWSRPPPMGASRGFCCSMTAAMLTDLLSR